MSSAPPITVILPAHNAEQTLDAAVRSVLQQTFTDFELWILENGSKDRTCERAESFDDPRVKAFKLGPVGFHGALSYGLENAKSEWIARLDSDDIMFPERLARQLETVRETKAVFCGTAMAQLTPFRHIIASPARLESRPVTRESLATRKPGQRKYFADPSVMFHRESALRAGGYDAEIPMGDMPLWFRLLEMGTGWEMGEHLHLYRLDPRSMSAGGSAYDHEQAVRQKYAPDYAPEWPDALPAQNMWKRIAIFEYVADSPPTARQALELAQNNSGGKEAMAALLLKAPRVFNPLIVAYFKRKLRNFRVHRPDYEQLLADLIRD